MQPNFGNFHRSGMGRVGAPQPAPTQQPASPSWSGPASTSAGTPTDPNANAANPNNLGDQMGSATASQPANPNTNPSGALPNINGSKLLGLLQARYANNPKLGPFGGNPTFTNSFTSGIMGQKPPAPPAPPQPPQANPNVPQPPSSPSRPIGV